MRVWILGVNGDGGVETASGGVYNGVVCLGLVQGLV